MLLAHYLHRLPADYDVGIIRARARERGPLWDGAADLYFKGFLLREAGRHGAAENSYSSLYLWRHDEALRNFLAEGHYRGVTKSFGRAGIQTRLVLDARKGSAAAPRFAYVEEIDIPVDADLDAALAREIERNRDAAASPGTAAAAVGVDPLNWRVMRVLLSDGEPGARSAGTAYQILHLARPLLHALGAGKA